MLRRIIRDTPLATWLREIAATIALLLFIAVVGAWLLALTALMHGV